MKESPTVQNDGGLDKDLAVFTVCNIAYLPRALVLARSLFIHEGRRLKVIVFDRKATTDVDAGEVEIIWIEDLGVPKIHELAFMYDIIEFSTSLKPFIALKLLQTHDYVVFLDPDIRIFDSLRAVMEDVRKYPIVLTPHYTIPQPNHPSESDLGMMRFGSFNLGFFAVSKSGQGIDFLEWWSARSIDYCFMESQFGLSTDQKWVSIAPCFFKDLHVSFNLGYNAAPWNTFEREISKTADGRYLVNGEYPLIFFHFSNFDGLDPEYLNKRASNEVGKRYPVLLELGNGYGASLEKATAEIKLTRYSFDYMSDGSYISPTLRRAYASVRGELPVGHDPFDSTGPVGDFARKNLLLTKSASRYSYPRLTESGRHKRAFAIIYWVMRLLLRVLGANRFYDLSKLMVLLSIYRRNRELWKL
jgi:hypothetical protein